MTRRIIWFAGLVAMALLATIAQVDRQARYDSDLARLVPAAFGGFAAEQRARSAVQRGDGEAALVELRTLIKSRPIPADHLSLLALARGADGDRTGAIAALEASAARGWRDPLPQLASAEAALAAGEYGIAAQRISALLATGALPEQTQALFTRQIATPEGREAMALRYAAKGHWQSSSLGTLAAMMEPANMADTLALAQANGANLPCNMLRQVATTYANRGHESDAARFWPGDCPEV